MCQISTRAEENDIVIGVEDQGPGLAPDFAPHAFDTFSRAEASRSRGHGGAGLGLSVVRAIAAAHRGRAQYRASTHGGAIFEIVLPLPRERDRIDEPAE